MNFERRTETKEKYGKNVSISIHLVRHGEKHKDGKLSKNGVIEARKMGEKMRWKKVVKGYYSSKERAKHTLEAILRGGKSNIDKEMRARVRKNLSPVILSNDFAKSIYFQELDEEVSKINLLPEEERIEVLKKIEERYVKKWLSYDSSRPDEQTSSPVDVAQKMAVLIDRYINMADRLKSGSQVDLINVTHEYMLASVVRYFLSRSVDGKTIKGMDLVDSIERIGYLEDIIININSDEKGRKKVSVLLRGDEYELDLGKIRKFLNLKIENN